MGIRCYCPQGHKLNVKAEQAGKIGICPKCRVRFQIPLESTRPSHSHKSEKVTPAEPEAPASVPSAPAPAESESWYILGGDGRQYGPVGRSVIEEWIDEHRVVAGTIVWTESRPRTEAREVFPQLGAPAAPISASADAAPPQSAPADELDALRRAALDSQKSVLQKRTGLNRKKKNRRDLFIVVVLSVVILVLLGILIALLTGGANKSEPVSPAAERPAASASVSPASPPAAK